MSEIRPEVISPKAESIDSTPRFVSGSLLRHVVVMSAAGATGLLSIFTVDLINIFYIALIGDLVLVSALGFAAIINFFNISFGIGIMVAAVTLVSRAIGAGELQKGRRYGGSSVVMAVIATVFLVVIEILLLPFVLSFVGATGRAYDVALVYLYIVVPSVPLMSVGMVLSGILRSKGDAKRSMYVTLSGGMAAAVLDPIFIFALDLGVPGAAIATGLARLVMMGVGIYGAIYVHKLIAMPRLFHCRKDLFVLAKLGGPVILTNLATPFGNGYLTAALASYGDEAVAAMAVLGRLIPFAFCGLFALTGSIGPIVGQNMGAGRIDRVRGTILAATLAAAVYTLVVWGILALFAKPLLIIVDAEGETAAMLIFFCLAVAPTNFFQGLLFIANAAFNTMARPFISTLFNWSRAILGTIPFVYFGAYLGGANGILMGHGLGGAFFGGLALLACLYYIGKLDSAPSKVGGAL